MVEEYRNILKYHNALGNGNLRDCQRGQMSVTCLSRVVFVWFGQVSIFLQSLWFEGKVLMGSLDRFSLIYFWDLVNEVDSMAVIQPANSALALAIRLELLLFR